MVHRLLPLIGLVCAAASVAQGGDPLKSPECRRAMDALQAQEARAASAPQQAASDVRRETTAALEAARRQAARTCLGGHGDPPPPSAHFTQPLTGVPSTTPPAVRPAPAVPAPSPAPVRAPAAVVTSCDATSCWTSDGVRVQRLGPTVIGPRGVCTVQGVTMSCP